MKNPYILVLGSSSDSQMLGVISSLRERSVPFLFLDSDTAKDLSFVLAPSGATIFTIDGKVLDDPTLVWTRLKIATQLGRSGIDVADEYIKRNEWAGFLIELSGYYEDKHLYKYLSARRVDRKLYQFKIASEVGFALPDTSFFVGKHHGKEFLRTHPSAVAKAIQARSIPAQGVGVDEYINLVTMPVDAEAVEQASIEDFEYCPQFFQARISNGWEYRTIGFRDRVFSFRYRIPVEKRWLPDERILYGGEYRGVSVYAAQFEAVQPPSELCDMISEFLVRAGLYYGAFDTIVTRSGHHIFLEVNTEGQWFAAAATNSLHSVCDHFAATLAGELAARAAG